MTYSGTFAINGAHNLRGKRHDGLATAIAQVLADVCGGEVVVDTEEGAFHDDEVHYIGGRFTMTGGTDPTTMIGTLTAAFDCEYSGDVDIELDDDA